MLTKRCVSLYAGLAHLEALEMLSNQSEKRVNTLLSALPPNAVTAIKPVLLKVKENFEMGEEEDEEVEDQEFDLLVTGLLKDLSVGTTPDKLVKVWVYSLNTVKLLHYNFCGAHIS